MRQTETLQVAKQIQFRAVVDGKRVENDRHSDILVFILLFTQKHSCPPTVREIMRGVKYSSTSVTTYQLEALQRSGVLNWGEGTKRSLQLKKQVKLEVVEGNNGR